MFQTHFYATQVASLSIASSPSWPGHLDQSVNTLLALAERSRFSLIRLSLMKQGMTLPELRVVSLLIIVPTLQPPAIKHCKPVTAPLLETLARGPALPADAPKLTHLHLSVLEVHAADFVEWEILVNTSPPPNYIVITFEEEVEERLAAVSDSGFLVDWYTYVWEWPPNHGKLIHNGCSSSLPG
ncbi:hypothetical protein C8R47DRAFT_1068110 [Mycena vitilis]|nr:hypothetical protein C8R47DRAFT_1068110 [Mycena vitilis]